MSPASSLKRKRPTAASSVASTSSVTPRPSRLNSASTSPPSTTPDVKQDEEEDDDDDVIIVDKQQPLTTEQEVTEAQRLMAENIARWEKTHEAAKLYAGKMDVLTYQNDETLFLTADEVEQNEKEAKRAPKRSKKNGAVTPTPVYPTQPRSITGGTLKDYQIEGVRWLIAQFGNSKGALLADEMGTGKTLQTISFLAFVREQRMWGHSLIVVPRVLLDTWYQEFQKFAPGLKVMKYYGTPAECVDLREDLGIGKGATAVPEEDQPIIITTFEKARTDSKYLAQLKYRILVIDEAHRIKNINAKAHTALKAISDVEFRLLLTGTPLQNNLPELFALLSFVLPEIFRDSESWLAQFEGMASKTDAKERLARVVDQVHETLRPYMLRRLKKDVEQNLPAKKEYILKAPMTERQLELYNATKTRTLRNVLIKEGGAEDTPIVIDESGDESATISDRTRGRRSPNKSSRKSYLEPSMDDEFVETIEHVSADEARKLAEARKAKGYRSQINAMHLESPVMTLRLIACHPYLAELNPMGAAGDDWWLNKLVSSSGKFQLLERLLPKLFEDGHKVLVFSQFTKTLDLIGAWADLLHDYEYYRLDGGNKTTTGDDILDFNNNKSPDATKLFLLSTRAGGVGLTLTGADTVILFDSDWNPQNDLQAIGRAHRIGQTKPVLVFRFEAINTVDTVINQRATGKLKLGETVLGEGQASERDAQDVLNKVLNKGKSRSRKAAGATILEDIEAKIDKQEVDFDGEQLISDADLNRLFKRDVATMEAGGSPKATSPSATRKSPSSKRAKAPVFAAVRTIDIDEEGDNTSRAASVANLFASGVDDQVRDDSEFE